MSETGAAFPDLTLLPRLAMLLHVSVDALLGVDSQRRASAIDAALAACNDAMQQGDAPAAVCALREEPGFQALRQRLTDHAE